jgi:hypothetical protein
LKTKFCFYSTLAIFFFTINIISSLVFAEIKIMPVGDSITRGAPSGVDDPDYMVSYRKALWELLDVAGYNVDYVGSLNNGAAAFGDTDLADHEGHGGWSDDEIVNGRPGFGKLADWLIAERPHIVLLHIGTNDLDPSPDDLEDILDVIDDHESNFNETVWVILARIINRVKYSQTTTDFNDNVEVMANDRINNPSNLAYPDNIIIVDMEDGANINYSRVTSDPTGDMWDGAHPYETGYEKMADVWFSGLQEILPVADCGSDQNKNEGSRVTLDASKSFDPDDRIDSYLWEQQPGVSQVKLSDPTAVNPNFTAPSVDVGGETLAFKVTVTDTDGLEAICITQVKILNVAENSSSSKNGGGGGG